MRPSACSGGMYAGVPRIVPAHVAPAGGGGGGRAAPPPPPRRGGGGGRGRAERRFDCPTPLDPPGGRAPPPARRELRQPPIDDQRLAELAEHDVGGLQVAVDHALTVRE